MRTTTQPKWSALSPTRGTSPHMQTCMHTAQTKPCNRAVGRSSDRTVHLGMPSPSTTICVCVCVQHWVLFGHRFRRELQMHAWCCLLTCVPSVYVLVSSGKPRKATPLCESCKRTREESVLEARVHACMHAKGHDEEKCARERGDGWEAKSNVRWFGLLLQQPTPQAWRRPPLPEGAACLRRRSRCAAKS